MLEAVSEIRYQLENGEVVSKEFLEKHAPSQRTTIEYLLKSKQISQEYADQLRKDRGEKTPEIYYED
jgi:hypothetical protein